MSWLAVMVSWLAGRVSWLAGMVSWLAARLARMASWLTATQASQSARSRASGGRAGPDAWRWPDAGATGDLGGGREPYRPWFTAGESPEPWFSSEPGG